MYIDHARSRYLLLTGSRLINQSINQSHFCLMIMSTLLQNTYVRLDEVFYYFFHTQTQTFATETLKFVRSDRVRKMLRAFPQCTLPRGLMCKKTLETTKIIPRVDATHKIVVRRGLILSHKNVNYKCLKTKYSGNKGTCGRSK